MRLSSILGLSEWLQKILCAGKVTWSKPNVREHVPQACTDCGINPLHITWSKMGVLSCVQSVQECASCTEKGELEAHLLLKG